MQENFNPNAVATEAAGIFGLPYGPDEAEIILVPVPWEATVSYGSGTSLGPQAIIDASMQVDLCHHDFPELWKKGIYVEELPEDIIALGKETKDMAGHIIASLQKGMPENDDDLRDPYIVVNRACDKLRRWVADRTDHWLSRGKKVGLIGGDHSTPLGFYSTQAENHDNFGLLVIDAHMDLRKAYEGFTYSHASIFYNALTQLPQVTKLVQVGIRDYCHEEKDFVASQGDRIRIFYDRDNRKQIYEGKTWATLCNEIITALPQKVHLSVDIDGLDPSLCPYTGTPVPGGLAFEELMYLCNALKASGKTIIGFDLCEVSPGETDWDGNVGARVLFQLCGLLT